MTISEIAQTHEGRCFRTPGLPPPLLFYSGHLHYWDGCSWCEFGKVYGDFLALTDFEFCPDPLEPEPAFDLTIGQALDAELAGKKVESDIMYVIPPSQAIYSWLSNRCRDSRWRIVEGEGA